MRDFLFHISNSLSSTRRWCSGKESNLHLPVRSRRSYPLEDPNDNVPSLGKGKRKMVTHGGLEPPPSRSQTERDTITLMSAKPGCAWRIRARICRRDIADEPVARIATLARISCDFPLLVVVDNRRRSARKGRRSPARLSPVELVARGRIELPSGGS